MPEITTDIAVLERLLPLAGTDLLDVGCGSGWLVRELAARGARAIGLEISEAQLELARDRDRAGLGRYRVGCAEDLPLTDGSVDAVVFMRSLHHVAVAQMMDALREARRVLRVGGVIYIAEPVAEGSFFELVSMVEDERVVRDAARSAIERAGSVGLERVTSSEYSVEGRYAGVGAFRAHMIAVEPERVTRFDARAEEIAVAFERLGEPSDVVGERRFLQLMRSDVLEVTGTR